MEMGAEITWPYPPNHFKVDIGDYLLELVKSYVTRDDSTIF